ncbi:hypothetical protein E6H28_02020 [Candidatus Bathyarchaeota archaeon]|nr:MAG: hypothetical protein E6H28_02020 [Candidatus Bathyarchaeota archaeon]
MRIQPGKSSLATILLLLLAVSLTTILAAKERAHATASTMPILGGWGGTRLKDTSQNLTGPASLVFPGERASNFEQIALEQVKSGYNTIRASFAPYCSVRYGLNSNASPQDFMGNYSAAQLARGLKIAEYFNMWIVVDYHGYSDFANSTLVSCWLNFWLGPNSVSGPTGVVGEFMGSYSRIVWEPLNEPASGSFPVSSEADKTRYAAAQYQAWINAARQLGDTHWVVVQNLCSYGCSRDRSHWYLNYPNVTDSRNRVFESLHTYMYYPAFVEHVAYDSNSNGIYDSGDIQIVGSIANGATLTGDPKIGFVNATNGQNEIWMVGKAIVYDSDSDGRYKAGDIPVTGTVPPIGTPLKFDPKVEFVDSNGNGVWDGWSNVTADAVSHQDYLTMLNETVRQGWPILNTEGGTTCNTTCPYIVPGPAGYSSVSLRYVQDIIDLADNTGLRIGRLFWAAASWTSTPNAGIYGALNPGQWGTLIESNSFQIVPILHDVAVDALHVTDGVIRVGTRVQVNVTVHNFGDEPETTSLMLYANNTTVGAQVVTNLPPETVREIPFAWYAGGSGSGLYVLKAVANQVQGETDLSDNSQTITVTVRTGASSGSSGPSTGVFDLFRNLFLSIYFPIIAVVILGGITIALRHRFSLKTSTSSP